MKIEYFHASKYGNGAMVAQEFKTIMSVENDMVNVQHIRDAHPKAMPPADLYVFSSPGRMGKPIGGMRRFLKNVRLPAGAEYAILTTEAAPKPDKKTGKMPTPEEIAKWQRVRPIMNELLAPKNLDGEGGGKLRLRDRAERSLGGRLAEGGEGLRLLGLVCQLTIDELKVVVAQGPRLSQHIGCGSRLVIPRSPGACAAGVEGSVTGPRSVTGQRSAYDDLVGVATA